MQVDYITEKTCLYDATNDILNLRIFTPVSRIVFKCWHDHSVVDRIES